MGTTDVLDKYMASVPTTREFSKAILELSVALDPKLVKDAVQAHKKAVEAMGPNFVTPLKNHEEVTTALANMFAAAPADKIKAVFDATPGRDDLPQCSKSRAKKCIYVKLALRQSCLPSFEGGMLRSEGHAGLESSRRAVRFDEAGQARCDKK